MDKSDCFLVNGPSEVKSDRESWIWFEHHREKEFEFVENKRGVTSYKGCVLNKGKSKKVRRNTLAREWFLRDIVQDLAWANTVEESGLNTGCWKGQSYRKSDCCRNTVLKVVSRMCWRKNGSNPRTVHRKVKLIDKVWSEGSGVRGRHWEC